MLGIVNEFGHLADNYGWIHDDFALLDITVWLAQVSFIPLYGGEVSPDRELLARFG